MVARVFGWMLTDKNSNDFIVKYLHSVFLVLSVVPAVSGFRYQQRDDVSFCEAEKGAVVSRGVGEEGLNTRPAISL